MLATTAAAGEGELRDIPLEQLHESPWNPRQYYPDGPMAELTQSMRESGFRAWLPIMVRPRGDEGGYEIGAGHRRSRAAGEAGLTVVPCIVRAMTDEEFLDVLNFDNCGREDVHPLHEAAGWNAWMEKTGKGVIDIAARIGQSKEYVYQRLKYSQLIEAGRKAFLDGEITAGHAILIARLQPADQKKALKACEPPAWNKDQRASVRDLASFIQRDIHLDLTRAAFSLEAEDLVPEAGACSVCPKRTRNSPELIPDPEFIRSGASFVRSGGDADECTDPGCFNSKLRGHLVRIKTELESKGGKVIEVAAGYGKAPKGALNANSYQEVPEGSAGSKVAVMVSGINAGKLIHIKLLPAPENRPGNRATAGSANDAAAARKKEQEARDAKAARERAVRVKILEAIRAKRGSLGLARFELFDFLAAVIHDIELPGAAALCELRGIAVPKINDWEDQDERGQEALVIALPGLSEAELHKLVVEIPLMDDFEEGSLIHESPKRLLDAARRYKVDAAKIRRQTEEALKAAEGGTRREVEKPFGPAKEKRTPAKKKAAAKAATTPKSRGVAKKVPAKKAK
jgi:ParB family chromosome partitioning protein